MATFAGSTAFSTRTLNAFATTADTAKVEGTTTTYGQDITISTPLDRLTADGIKVSVDTLEQIQPQEPSPIIQILTNPPTIQDEPTPTVSSQGLEALKDNDIIVEVIQKANELAHSQLGVVENVSCKVRTNIAVAAASSNASVATVNASTPIDSTATRSIAGGIFGNFMRAISNVSTTAIVRGSSIKSREEIKKSLTEAQKVDLSISLKSKESESVNFNTLKTPVMEASYVYNFFSESEKDRSEEDRSKDPLLTNKPYNVPRYVLLKWGTAKVTQPLTGTERVARKNRELRRQIFSTPRGVETSTDNTKFVSSIKSAETRIPSAGRGEITDIHNLQDGFNIVANDNLFSNVVTSVFNVSGERSELRTIPFLNFGISR